METQLEKEMARRCVCGHMFKSSRGGGEYRSHRATCHRWIEFKVSWSKPCGCGCLQATKFLKDFLDGHQPHPSGAAHASFGKPLSADTKQKIRAKALGRSAPNKGVPHSEATKLLIGMRNRGKTRSDSVKKKMSERMKVQNLGRRFSAETRALISMRAKQRLARLGHPMHGKKHRPETLHLIGLKAAQRLRGNGGFSEGSFWSGKNNCWVMYRSSYEKVFYQALEAMAVVSRYIVEPDIIPYTFRGRLRHYVPDVLVEFSLGITEVYEVKPRALHSNAEVLAKASAATEFYGNQGIAFKIVGESEISSAAMLA